MSAFPPNSTGSREYTAADPQSRTPSVEGPHRWRLPKGALAIAALALAGATVFLYPSTASWLSQYDQSKVVVGLAKATYEAGPQSRLDALAAAAAYNQLLTSQATLPENAHKPVSDTGAASDDRYETLLHGDVNGAMGRLRIDAIDVDLPIYHGTDDATLEKGVGHLQGTSLPVGGASTHAVLTAHRGLAEATLFDRLDELKNGDTFQLEVFGEVLSYRVFETKVIEPDDTASLFPRFGKDLVTLVTCTPLGINSHRILVTAERVLPTPIADVQQAGVSPEIPGTPWWAIGLGLTVTMLTLYVYQQGRGRGPAVTPRQRS